MERMKLTEKEKDQIVKSGAEAMSKIIERMSIEMGELEEENKKLNEEIENHKQNIMQDELEIIPKLEEENKKLKEEIEKWKDMVKTLNEYNKFRIAENKKLKETIKDHQLYEEKLEHGIIELEELLHGE